MEIKKTTDKIKPSPFILTSRKVEDKKAKRIWYQSYLSLTQNGKMTPMLNWIEAENVPTMLPPRAFGSSKSLIMNYLEPEHFNVQLTENEKRIFACWIDLGIPYCGSYTQANLWSPDEKKLYQYFQKKREVAAYEELNALKSKIQKK